MPDSSWKLIGIPISLWKLEKEAYLLLLIQKHLKIPAKPSLDSWGVHRTYTCVLTSLNKHAFRIDIPTVLKNITQVPAATRENPWDFPFTTRWGPFPVHCMQSNCVFPNKHIRILDLLDWTLESPQQDCHKARRTLMSPQERKIDWCTPNQLRMQHISASLNP